MESPNSKAGETQQQADGGELETRMSRTGSLASMLRYDDDALEDTPGIEPDRVESEISSHLDESPTNTETGPGGLHKRWWE